MGSAFLPDNEKISIMIESFNKLLKSYEVDHSFTMIGDHVLFNHNGKSDRIKIQNADQVITSMSNIVVSVFRTRNK